MGGGVAFQVAVLIVPGDCFIQRHEHVPGDVGIGVFIDGDGGRRMGNKNMTETIPDVAFSDNGPYHPRNINHVRSRTGLDGQLLYPIFPSLLT